MYKLRFAVATAALAVALASGANAATVSIQAISGGTTTTFPGATSNNIQGGFTVGNFFINSVSGSGNPSVVLPDLLLSNSIDTNATGSGTLILWITAQGITTPLGSIPFLSGLTSNLLTAGWTVTESTFIDAGNHTFLAGAVTPLASHMFSAQGTFASTNTAATGVGPYSITEEYVIVASGAGSANSTIDVAAVPEPATWGMMLLGFLGLGFAFRQSRRKVSFA